MPRPRLPGSQAEVRVSDPADPGTLSFGEVLPGASAVRPTEAPADDAPIETEAHRQGDPARFATMLQRLEPSIWGVVNAYSKDAHDREDMYQEVCIRLLTREGDYREQGARTGWVVTVARGVCRDWRKSQAARSSATDRYSAEFPPKEESDDLFDDPSRLFQFQAFLERLERALAELPLRQATAWRLVHFEGHSVHRAARMTKTTPATIRSNIRHARIRLRELTKDARRELS